MLYVLNDQILFMSVHIYRRFSFPLVKSKHVGYIRVQRIKIILLNTSSTD